LHTTGIVYSPYYLQHNPGPSHPESPLRLSSIINTLEKAGIFKDRRFQKIVPQKATIQEVTLVHDLTYLKKVASLCQAGGGYLDSDTPVCAESYEVALLAVGGVLKACDLILSGEIANAFALIRPPGHHAGPSGPTFPPTSAGFCIFNNVAIAAKYLMKKYDLKKVAIIDVDAHHGNGTQRIFNTTSHVLYVSLHQDGRTLYPGTGFLGEIGEGEGKGFKVNIPLPPHSNDEIYLKAMKEIVIPVVTQFRPEFIIISAGFDAHYADPIANMAMSSLGYLQEFQMIMDIASKVCDGRLLAVLEGGYNLEALSKTVAAIIMEMAKASFELKDSQCKSSQRVKDEADRVMVEVKNTLSTFWSF
jgi:acetoin utilization deacetylase AcuC-like enzyme